MKVLIVVEHSPKQRFLVSFYIKKMAKEVRCGFIGYTAFPERV